jgi:hypothetical protein
MAATEPDDLLNHLKPEQGESTNKGSETILSFSEDEWHAFGQGTTWQQSNVHMLVHMKLGLTWSCVVPACARRRKYWRPE